MDIGKAADKAVVSLKTSHSPVIVTVLSCRSIIDSVIIKEVC